VRVTKDDFSERLRVNGVLNASPGQEVATLTVGKPNLDCHDVLHAWVIGP
jgi:hypothetical protein